MRILFSKTDALGDQLLATGFCRQLIEQTGCQRFYWLLRRGYETVAGLWDGSTVFNPDRRLAPPQAAAELEQRLAALRHGAAPVFIPTDMDAYHPWPPERDLDTTLRWWGDFARCLQPDLAIAGTCMLNWVDWFLTAASGAPRRAAMHPGFPNEELPPCVNGYFTERGGAPPCSDLAEAPSRAHELDRFAALLGCLGLPRPELRVQIHVPAEVLAQSPQSGALLVYPGSGDPQRAWPPERFAEVAARIVSRRMAGFEKVSLLCGPADQPIARSLNGQLRQQQIETEIIEVGAGGLRPVAALLAKAALLLSNDTFIVHLATALGTPTVAIWGGGHWGRFVPRHGAVSVVHQPLPCYHCDWNCLFSEYRCISTLPTDTVLEAVAGRLREPAAPVTIVTAPAQVPSELIYARFHGIHRGLARLQRQQDGLQRWVNLEITAKKNAIKWAEDAELMKAKAEQWARDEQAVRLDAEQQLATERVARQQAQATAEQQLATERVARQQAQAAAEQQLATERVARQQAQAAAQSSAQSQATAEQQLQQERLLRLGAEQRAEDLRSDLDVQLTANSLLAREVDSLKDKVTALSTAAGAARTLLGNAYRRVAAALRNATATQRMRAALPDLKARCGSGHPALTVTLVNTHDIIGGAERASFDLLQGLRGLAINVHLLVGAKLGQDPDVTALRLGAADGKLARFWRDRFGLTEVIHLSPLRTVRRDPLFTECDVANLHNMHGRYWNMLTVPLIRRRAPVVLTLHDEFLLTGDCGYSYDCTRWQRSCGRCPQAQADPITRYPATGADRTRLNILIKRAILRAPGRHPLQLVTPTRWLAERVQQSPNLNHLPLHVIPYGIPLGLWKPMPQDEARRHLGLPLDKLIGVFSANRLAERRKGIDLLVDAIRSLSDKTPFQFVALGQINDEFARSVAGLPVRCVGHLRERSEIVRYLSAAHFTMVTSRADNLPYSALESLACGRPVIGTRVGGIPEIVESPSLGWLLPVPPQSADLRQLLEQLPGLSAAEWTARFAACRASAEQRYDLRRMVNEYASLFHQLLENRP